MSMVFTGIKYWLILSLIFTGLFWFANPLAIWLLPPPDQGGNNETANDNQLQKAITEIDKKLERKIPTSHYLLINSAANEFSLMKKRELVKRDKCSTGSYIKLKSENQKQWMFKTPKGEFKILSKTKNPVWKKPDWAFVEAGLPIPPINDASRFEYGVLGDYSLSIGNGYLIHGTLYQRLLGLPVTHGCVRLNDENLALVYKSLPVGNKVYIF